MTSTDEFLTTVSDLPTHWLTGTVLRCYSRTDRSIPLWTLVEYTQAGAEDFYDSLSDEEARYYAAELLAPHGWDRRSICFTRS